MQLLDFVKLHRGRPDHIGDAASALFDHIVLNGIPETDALTQFQEEAASEGVYRGLRDLWKLWEEEQARNAPPERETPPPID